jgi:hypothetical protein
MRPAYPSKRKHDKEDVEERDSGTSYSWMPGLIRGASGYDRNRGRHSSAREHKQLASAERLDKSKSAESGDHHDRRLDSIQK